MSDTTQAFNINTVLDDAKKVILNPVSFYKNMPQTGGLVNPLIFVLVMSVITGIILALYSLFGTKLGGFGFSLIIVFPIFGLIGSFIGAAILFVIWKLIGSEKNYEVAYRCVAYSFVIVPLLSIISFIPYIAGVIQKLWGCFLMYIASKEVHGIKEKTAMIVFGVLAAITVLWGIGSENASRELSSRVSSFEKEFNVEKLENMTPEQLGETTGKFLEGLNRALEDAKKEK